MRGQSWRLGYRPALDGFRGIAILLVLIAHAGVPHLGGGGATGVTLFFVLSGFLITALLAEERRETGRIDLLAFYGRRALRLLPALVVLIVVVVSVSELALAFHSSWIDNRAARKTANPVPPLAAMFYSANWVIALGREHSIGGFLDHTWSLSIEEQFYLVWPVLLLAGVRMFGLRSLKLIVTVLGLAALSMAEGFWLWWRSSGGAAGGRIYFGTDTRADGILIGCVLALWLVSGRTLRIPTVLVIAGVSLVAFSTYTADDFILKLPVVAIAGGAVLVGAALQPSLAIAFLAWRPLRWIGRISYSLYLWHLPVIALLRPNLVSQPLAVQIVLFVLASFGAALASYAIVERYFLRLKTRVGRVAPSDAPVPLAQTAKPAAA